MTSVVVETLVIRPFVVRIFLSMYYVAFRAYRSSFCIRAIFISFHTGEKCSIFLWSYQCARPQKSRGRKAATVEEYESDESNDEVLTSSQVASTGFLITSQSSMESYVHASAPLECDVENVAQQLVTVNDCNKNLSCILSAKMFENPDVSGLLSLHQWKMPLH